MLGCHDGQGLMFKDNLLAIYETHLKVSFIISVYDLNLQHQPHNAKNITEVQIPARKNEFRQWIS